MAEPVWIMLILAAFSSVAGYSWLALAMDTHWQQVHGSARPLPAQKILLRLLGITGITASAVLCFLADRPSMAVLVWIMLLAGAAPVVAFTLAWRPSWLRALFPFSQG